MNFTVFCFEFFNFGLECRDGFLESLGLSRFLFGDRSGAFSRLALIRNDEDAEEDWKRKNAEQNDDTPAVAWVAPVKEFCVTFRGGRAAIPACAIVKFIRTLAACVLVGGISMVIVVFAGGAVVMSAIFICLARMGKGHGGQQENGQKSDANGENAPFHRRFLL